MKSFQVELMPRTLYSAVFKRVLDVMLSTIALLLLALPFVFIAVLIKLTSTGPVFFRQERVGRDLKRFKLLKFRSMTNEQHEVRPIIGRASGVTVVGEYLRRYKIDELPQLVNVLRGEMSIVGPRPSIPAQLDNMTEKELARYSVRPGLTGLAQVSGNIHISWKERFEYDRIYIRNISFFSDVKIIIRTLAIVVWGEEKYVHSSKNLIKDKENSSV